MDEERQHWALDKRVPIALIVTLGVQTMVIVWWAATASFRLDQLEHKVEKAAPQAERIIRLEEKLGVVQQGITRIEALISRQLAPGR